MVSKDGQPMKRESDLIDVWFDSGAMPYAQIHYPFENKELLDSRQVYPADFIAEGVDQKMCIRDRIVTVVDDKIVGCALSIIVDYDKVKNDHTYAQVTCKETFNTHRCV